jgi:toxin CptA
MLVQRIAVSPSVLLAIAICVAHLLAAGLLWLLPIPAPGKSVLTLLIAVSLVFLLARDAALHSAHAIIALEIKDDGVISFQTRSGAWVDCTLLASSYVSPRLTILNLRPASGKGKRRVIIVPGNVDSRDFRRLRMWLRWRQAGGSGVAPAADG